MTSFLLKEQILKSEILWALKSTSSRFSYRSCTGLSELFSTMFPDSEIAVGFSMGKTKLAYIVTYGLAYHFREEIRSELNKSDYFTVCFDEALNKIAQSCQMDILVRYFGPHGVHTSIVSHRQRSHR